MVYISPFDELIGCMYPNPMNNEPLIRVPGLICLIKIHCSQDWDALQDVEPFW